MIFDIAATLLHTKMDYLYKKHRFIYTSAALGLFKQTIFEKQLHLHNEKNPGLLFILITR